MIPWTTDEVIHRIVKRDVPNSERGTIATLNDLPTWMVDEAREIARESRLAAVRYLRFYVATQHSSSAEDFVEDVLLRGDDARTWEIRDCILVPNEFGRIGAFEIAPYLGALATIEGERWFRIKPRLTDHLSDFTPGMIGVVQRRSRYWHNTPPGITRCPLAGGSDAEFVMPEQLDSCIRRWIAHRLAWWAREYLEQDRAQATGNRIIQAASEPQRGPATADVQLAASALAREARTYADSPVFPQQAGFLGPDDWYQSPMQADASDC
jgi:hypothetical protein